MSDFQLTLSGEGCHQARLRLSDPPPPPQPWTEKYRPAKLTDVIGQGWAVRQLASYLGLPYSTAFLFEGPTGVGKTSLALAVANELKVDRHWGMTVIKSGEMDAEAVQVAIKSLRFTAPGGGWKFILADEADLMSTKAKHLWLSILEALPPRSIIVFTSNDASRFQARFRDRCQRIQFTGDPTISTQDANQLATRIWKAEGMTGKVPTIPDSILIEDGTVSFRRAVQFLQAASLCLSVAKASVVSTMSSRSVAGFKAAATRKARKEAARG